MRGRILIAQPQVAAIDIDRDAATALFGLTAQGSRVAALVCAGASTPEIAVALGVVPDTVRYHLKSIFEKTGSRKRSELVALLAQLA